MANYQQWLLAAHSGSQGGGLCPIFIHWYLQWQLFEVSRNF
jgi:hypothetical protein